MARQLLTGARNTPPLADVLLRWASPPGATEAQASIAGRASGLMDRCAVLVDAGYLLGAAGTILAADRSRGALVVDHAGLVAAIIAEATGQTGLPVLRVLWYDGAHEARPAPEHRTLSLLPDVKVRLGILVHRDGKLQQKGVDSFLQRDLAALARNRAVADVVLIGGDEDLRRGLDEAQDHGVKVHLWAVEAAAPQYNQSRSLIAEADRRWVLSAAWLTRFITTRTAEAIPETAATGEPPPDEQPTGDEPGKGTPVHADGSSRPAATPADIARLVTPQHGLVTAAPAGPEPTEHAEVPRLRDLSDPRQKWQDNEDDTTAGPLTPADIGTRYGTRWTARATDNQRVALARCQPMLPRQVDGELLKYAQGLGVDTWEDEPAKIAVRAAVWEQILTTSVEG